MGWALGDEGHCSLRQESRQGSLAPRLLYSPLSTACCPSPHHLTEFTLLLGCLISLAARGWAETPQTWPPSLLSCTPPAPCSAAVPCSFSQHPLGLALALQCCLSFLPLTCLSSLSRALRGASPGPTHQPEHVISQLRAPVFPLRLQLEPISTESLQLARILVGQRYLSQNLGSALANLITAVLLCFEPVSSLNGMKMIQRLKVVQTNQML